jgi:hypothetical protein
VTIEQHIGVVLRHKLLLNQLKPVGALRGHLRGDFRLRGRPDGKPTSGRQP